MAKSPSAFATHSTVIGFIEDRSCLKDVAEEGVAQSEALAHGFGATNDQIEREARSRPQPDLDGLVDRAALEGEDDEKIHVRVRSRFFPRVRAEEEDPERPEVPGDPEAQPADIFFGGHLAPPMLAQFGPGLRS